MQTEFTTTDILAIIGAVTGAIGTVAGVAAFSLGRLQVEAFWTGSQGYSTKRYAASHEREVEKPDGPYLLIKVVNIGQSKTVIEDVSLAYFETRWNMWTRWDRFTFNSPRATGVTPHTLEPGERWFNGYTSRSKV